jgi:hypothetical protein
MPIFNQRLQNFLRPQFTNVCNKLECLSQANSYLVYCLLVRQTRKHQTWLERLPGTNTLAYFKY